MSDTDRAPLAKSFGVPFQGYTARQSFVIGADGLVKKVYRKVDVTVHAQGDHGGRAVSAARLAVIVDGSPLPEEEARTFWARFSEYMDAHAGDLSRVRPKRGLRERAPRSAKRGGGLDREPLGGAAPVWLAAEPDGIHRWIAP